MFLISKSLRCPRHVAIKRNYSLNHKLSSHLIDNIYWNDRFDPGESRFEKVLVANRGEIACRIIRTCQRLGMKTVAVYSEADSSSLFVKLADESVCIGPASTTQSYLDVDSILSAVSETGADAVHPGYGFLSENWQFIEKLSATGAKFVGPNANTMRLLGDKIESKRMAKSVGIKCVPGYDEEVSDTAEAFKMAEDIGYPIMIKASAGGGGKGMRIVRNPAELPEALRMSKQEAKFSFGDDRVFLERALPSARHVEVQVLCDQHGNVLHLHARDCSIQRRNQKLIEEAPSVLFSSFPSLYYQLCESAVLLAKSAGYDSAGTVEFLLDSTNPRDFYFLEVNTRLQVEHPVTECITGIDIVHQMLRIAQGHKLLYQQTEEDIPCRGWALECRVCAEDPLRNLGSPSVGQLVRYQEPYNLPGVRCDSSVTEGSRISIFYDPLISKLIVHGWDRGTVLKTMAQALDSYIIRGVKSNIALLRDIISHPTFTCGDYNLQHLNHMYPNGFHGSHLSQQEYAQLISVGAVVHLKALFRHFSDSQKCKSQCFTLNIALDSSSPCFSDGITKVSVTYRGDYFEVQLPSSQPLRIPNTFSLSDCVIQSGINGQIFQLCGRNSVGNVCLQYRGEIFRFIIRSEEALEALSVIGIKELRSSENYQSRGTDIGKCLAVRAPLPGLVTSICVIPGQWVSEGDDVCVLEAMKMRNCLHAPKSGTVKSVYMTEGQTVSEGDTIMELE